MLLHLTDKEEEEGNLTLFVTFLVMFTLFKCLNCIKKQHLNTITRFCHSKTIFAVSSGQGKCAVAIVRISGKDTAIALKTMTGLVEVPKPRTAILKKIIHPHTNEVLDKGLILWFPGPKSFTGEDSCELHVHGGIAVINAVLNALGTLKNFQLAEPGEFTRRAFFNGKLDLTEVEGLADLLQAETEFQRKQAFLQTQGSLSKIYNKWKEKLLRCLAHFEAYLDFDETENLDLRFLESVFKQVKELSKEIEMHLKDGRRGEILRNGVKTCIIGEPNVGKSSLMNILCKRPAAIVTPIEGTTRDILEVTLNIGGYPLVLADTAGLRLHTKDIIEKEGMLKARENYQESDLIILVIDGKKYKNWKQFNPLKTFDNYLKDYTKSMNLNNFIDKKTNTFTKQCLVVCNKIDLLAESDLIEQTDYKVIKVSCKNENGISNLVDNISDKLKIICGNPSKDHPSMNQMRHRQHLSDCLKCLNSFLNKCSNINENNTTDLVLTAEYLRKAIKYQEKLVGKITTEQVLDVIFKDFCIGK